MSLLVIASRKLGKVQLANVLKTSVVGMSGGIPGSGAGKGGGTGGSIRDSGGAFGERGAAREEEYFRRLQKEQLQKLKGSFEDQVRTHEQLIKSHQDAIDKAKKELNDLEAEKN